LSSIDIGLTNPKPKIEYVPEAFQHLILQFILANRYKEFITQCVDRQFPQVKVIGQNLSLLGAGSSRWHDFV
jgi:hypothetical protein